ncbi:unnamed protein product [Heterobilharzia americana]|nr:unnamed protein product [Heterobilharzia americana]
MGHWTLIASLCRCYKLRSYKLRFHNSKDLITITYHLFISFQMLSAKLRFLRGLAPVVSFHHNDSLLHYSNLSNNKYEVLSRSFQSDYINLKNVSNQQSYHLIEGYLHKFSSTIISQSTVNHFTTSKASITRQQANKSVETKNQSCQTDISQSDVSMHSLSMTISQLLHKLNCHELKCISKGKEKKFPTLWLNLSELNYSPAQYNLGVWYELQASTCCTSLHNHSKQHYTNQASYWYSCAVKIDSHPFAAYNLACLILNSNSPLVYIDCSDKQIIFSVKYLMKLAADKNIEQAKKYLSEQQQYQEQCVVP